MSLPRSLAFALLLAAFVGCDEGIEPTPGTDRVFTLYGQLDADADTQAVRVIPIAETIDTLDPDSIDARVISTHLQSGETRVWRDSLVQYADGTEGHVFFAPMRVRYEDTHRLDVMRSDGEVASVTVTVPPLTTLDSLARVASPSAVNYVIGVQRAPRLTGVRATYTFAGDIPSPQIVRHTDRAERVPGGWEVAIPFLADVEQFVATFEPQAATLLTLEVSVYVSNEEWNVEDASGTFDPDVLVEPGTLSNVENGFGFFGAGYRLSRQLCPLRQDQLRAGLDVGPVGDEAAGCVGR